MHVYHLTRLVTLGGEPMPLPCRKWFEHRRCIQCDTRSRECVLTCVEPFPARSAYFHFDPEDHWRSSSDRLLCLRCCDKVKLCLCGRKDCSIPVVPYKKMYPEPYTKTTTASFLCTGQEPPKNPTQRRRSIRHKRMRTFLRGMGLYSVSGAPPTVDVRSVPLHSA